MIDTGNYLSAKSGILFSVIHSGFMAVIFYFIVFEMLFGTFGRPMQVTTKILLRITLWYSLLSILFAVNIEVLYAFLLPFIVVNYLKQIHRR